MIDPAPYISEIRNLQQGDDKAFNFFFKKLYKPLVYFSQSIIREEEESKDIVLLAFEKFWKRRALFESYANIKAFLYMVCRNACFDHLKQAKRKVNREHEFTLSLELIEHDEQYLEIETELLSKINLAIEKLPNKCQQIFKLSFIEQRPAAEIAALLNISTTTVATQRFRAIQLLRAALADPRMPVTTIFLAALHQTTMH